jgi:hypothetical protein
MYNTIEFYLKNPIIKHDVGILLVKDIQHRFVASNSGFSIFSGLPPENLIGLSDFDMPWSEQAKIYISHEKDILSGLSYNVIEPLLGIKRANLVTQKKIIYDQAIFATFSWAIANFFFGRLDSQDFATSCL